MFKNILYYKKAKYATNKGGAKYGTGYCDAQCPHDVKWINGKANSGGWIPSTNDGIVQFIYLLSHVDQSFSLSNYVSISQFWSGSIRFLLR